MVLIERMWLVGGRVNRLQAVTGARRLAQAGEALLAPNSSLHGCALFCETHCAATMQLRSLGGALCQVCLQLRLVTHDVTRAGQQSRKRLQNNQTLARIETKQFASTSTKWAG